MPACHTVVQVTVTRESRDPEIRDPKTEEHKIAVKRIIPQSGFKQNHWWSRHSSF